MNIPYTFTINGNIDGLSKVIHKAGLQMKQLENNQVLINFDYNTNMGQFQKVFEELKKNCPDLTVQFQYEVNKQFLNKLKGDQKNIVSKLENSLKDIQIDPAGLIDEDGLYNVQKIIENLSEKVKSLDLNLSLDESIDEKDLKDVDTILESYYKISNIIETINNKELGIRYDTTDLNYLIEDLQYLKENLTKTLSDEYGGYDGLRPVQEVLKELTDFNPVTLIDNKQLTNNLELIEEVEDILNKLRMKGADDSFNGVFNLGGEVSKVAESSGLTTGISVKPDVDIDEWRNDIQKRIDAEMKPVTIPTEPDGDLVNKIQNEVYDSNRTVYVPVYPGSLNDFTSAIQRYVSNSDDIDLNVTANVTKVNSDGDFKLDIADASLKEIYSELTKISSLFDRIDDPSIFDNLIDSLSSLKEKFDEIISAIQNVSINLNITQESTARDRAKKIEETRLTSKEVSSYERIYDNLLRILEKNGYNIDNLFTFIDKYGTKFGELENTFNKINFKNLDPTEQIERYASLFKLIKDRLDEFSKEDLSLEPVANLLSQIKIPDTKTRTKEAISRIEKIYEDDINNLENTSITSLIDRAFNKIPEIDFSSIIEQIQKISDILSEIAAKNPIKEIFEINEEEVKNIATVIKNISDAYSEMYSGDEISKTEKETKSLANDIKAKFEFINEIQESILKISKSLNDNITVLQEHSEKFSKTFSEEKNEIDKVGDSVLALNSDLKNFTGFDDLISKLKEVNDQIEIVQKLFAELSDKKVDIQLGDIKGVEEAFNRVSEIINGIDFKNVNKLTSALKKLGESDIVSNLESLCEIIKKIVDELSKAPSEIKFLDKIEGILKYKNELKNLSTILSASNKKIKEVSKAIEEDANKQKESNKTKEEGVDKYKEYINQLKNAKKILERLQNKKDSTEDFANASDYEGKLKSISSYIDSLQNKKIDLVDENARKEIDDLISGIKNLESESNNFKNIKGNANSLEKSLGKVSKILASDLKIPKQLRGDLEDFKSRVEELISQGKYSKEQVAALTSELLRLDTRVKSLGNKKDVLKQVGQRLADMNAKFLATYFSWQDWIRYLRQAASTINELDKAMTEMRKVSDETITSLKNYQSESFGVAKSIGTDAIALQNATASWMRLGESMEDAKESAKDATILMNVSEFDNIDDATESLISMSQAYKEMGKMDILDVLNKLGNETSASTAGIATSLQDSASALRTAGNDFYEAAALVVAGNNIVQNPEMTGKGMRTIALRLTGTDYAKQQLEELGEDIEDFEVTTTAKMQETIMDLTKTQEKAGVNILDMNGNYRSTYEILQDIADVWEQIAEEDKITGENRQNALLEKLAGKNRANILASILSSPDVLRTSYEKAQNAQGSALEENAKYIDSIEGKISQLRTTVQELIFNMGDSDFIKDIIENATDLLSVLDDMSEDIGETFTDDIKPILDFTSDILKMVLGVSSAISGVVPGLNRVETILGSIIGMKVMKGSALSQLITIDSEGTHFLSNFLGALASIKKTKFNDVITPFFGEKGIDIKGNVDLQREIVNLVKLDEVAFQTQKDMQGVDSSAYQVANSLRTAGVSAKATQAGFNAINAGSRAAAVGVSVLNTALSMGLSLFITWGATTLFSWIDDLVHKEENAAKKFEEIKQKAEQASNSISDITKKQSDLAKSTKDLGNRYAELSKKVENVGTAWQSQGDLSDSEYEEFLNVSKQLAELYPSLTLGYNENGDAILDLNGDVETITNSLQLLLDTQRQLANEEISKNMEDVFKGYVNNVSALDDEVSKVESSLNAKGTLINDVLSGSSAKNLESYKDILEVVAKNRNIELDELISSYDQYHGSVNGNSALSYDFSELKLTDSDKEAIQKYYDSIKTSSELEIDKLQKSIDNQINTLSSNILSAIYGDINYQSFDSQKQNIVNSMLLDMDWKKIISDNQLDNWDELSEYISDNIISTMNNIDDSTKDEMVKIFTNADNLTSSEIDSLYNDILKQLEEKGASEPIVAYWTTKYQKNKEEDDALFDKFFGYNKSGRYSELRGDWVEDSKGNLNYVKSEYEKWFDELDQQQKKLLSDVTIDYDLLFNSQDPISYLDRLIAKQKIFNDLLSKTNNANITDSVEALNAKVNPQMNTLTGIYSSMLGDSGLNPSEFSNEQMQSLIDSFKSNDELGIEFNTEELEEFFEVLADGEATVDETQEAFDRLATKWIESSKAIDTLNVNNREYINQQLEQMGITNAEEMTAAELISQQIDLANATYKVSMEEAKAIENKEESKKAINDTKNALYDEIAALVEEGGAYEDASEAAKAYAISKQIAEFDFVGGDISQLNAMVQALGVGVEAWEEYYAARARMQAELEKPKYNGSGIAETEYLKTFQNNTKDTWDEFKNMIDDTAANYHISAPSKSSSSSSSKSSKEEKDPVIEQYEKEYNILKWLLDNGYIDQKEYYDQLRILYEKFFKDKDKYAKEYAEKEREYLEGLKTMYEGTLSSIISLFDKEVDKINKAKDKKLKALEEEQKKQKEALQAQIDAAENNIKNKQNEIDALQKANEERKRELDLQKALYDQQRAMNQRTILQYNEDKGYHYVADTNAIKDANEKVEDVKYEQQVAALQKELDLLNDIKDTLDAQMKDLEDSFEKQKKELEDYYTALAKPFEDAKTKWQELQETIEMAGIINSLKELGYNIDDILADKDGVFDKFKSHLLGVYGDLSAGNEVLRASFLEAFNTDNLGSYLQASESMMGQLNALDLSSYKTGIETSSQDALAFRDRIAEVIDKIALLNNSPLTLNVDDSRLKELEAGGGVNLEVRPVIDTSELLNAGWEDAGEGAATIFSNTFSNAAGNIAVNFTPIIADPTTGAYKGVLSPQELEDYAMEVINGVHPDYLNLQIGAQFTGDNAVDLATAAAEEIHTIHGEYTDNMLGISNETMDTISANTDFIVSQSEVATSTIQGNIDSLHGKDITITIHTKHVDDGKGGLGSNAARLGGTAYAGGKWQAGKDETALLAEEGAEIIAHRDGTYEIVGKNGAEFRNVKHDDVVFDAEQTKKLLEHGRINSRGKAYANGKDNYVPLSIADPDKFKMLNAFTSFVDVVQPEIVKMSDNIEALVRKVVTSPMSSTSNNAQNINLNIGDIHLTGVQDVNGLSQAIVQRLPNQILQEINKR